MHAQNQPILQMRGIVKEFSGVRALDRVDFDVHQGQVHALIGENGAGKSTLVNVLAGRFDDYLGQITVRARHVRLENPRDVLKLGVGSVFWPGTMPGPPGMLFHDTLPFSGPESQYDRRRKYYARS